MRRAKYLLDESLYDQIERDQSITYTMRSLSCYCTVGQDLNSRQLKLVNQNISLMAFSLLESKCSKKEWFQKTINDHSKPLDEIWKWIRKNNKKLKAKDIIKEFKDFPVITIHRDEDKKLNKKGYRSKGSICERYKDIHLYENFIIPKLYFC